MTILSLDTTTRDGSAAFIVDGRVIDERRGDATRTHAERLPSELMALAASNGTTLGAIDLFAVASGPGSFTGLRVGIAAIQGAAFVHARPVVAVSALDALAYAVAAGRETGLVGVWMDAHRSEVFSSLYQITSGPPFDPRCLQVIEPAMVNLPSEVLSRWARAAQMPATIIGDGAVRFAGAIQGAAAHVGVRQPPLLAGVIGQVATVLARRGETISPAAIQPLYVRRPDAEIDREKRAEGRLTP